MTTILRATRRGAAALTLLWTGACASGSGGQISDILGSVLGGGAQQGTQQGAQQVSGVVRGVDTRNQQIALQLSNGQQVGLGYDQQTKVVYNNQSYAVSSLDPGDQVTARVQSTQGGAYYTDLLQVDQPVQGSAGGNTNGSTGTTTGSGNVQSFQGTVRQIDAQNGLFSITSGNATVTVSLPYNVSRADQNRFQSLRAGDTVRLYGVFLNQTRVELRQFY